MLKSPPELWAECSNAASLARHLGEFGEIRITKLEPETAVAWEGSAARGTVRLEPAGWGTKVFLTATEEEAPTATEAEPDPEPAALPPPEPEPASRRDSGPEAETEAAPAPPVRRGFFSRLMSRFQGPSPPTDLAPHSEPDAEPAPEPEPAPDPEPAQGPAPATAAPANTLDAALDSLGSAHHRPYSRA